MPHEWRGKMCPVLSAGVVTMPEPSKIVSVDGQPGKRSADMSVLQCQGPACAWFMSVRDETGQVVDGHCAVMLGSAAVNNVVNLVQMAMVAQAQPQAQTQTQPVIPNKGQGK